MLHEVHIALKGIASPGVRHLFKTLLMILCLALFGMTMRTSAFALGSGIGYATEDVFFENEGTVVHGTLLLPEGLAEAGGSAPGVVLIGGAGPRLRDAYLAEAEAFAQAGVVVLVYDKRTEGYSLTERSFDQLGRDALAGVELLRQREEVNPDMVGLWGHSEGGWVVPIAAASSQDVAFAITVGASALSPAQAQSWSSCRYLVHGGFDEGMCAPLASGLTALMVEGGIFPEAGFDPVAYLRALDIPVLVLLAEHDRSTVPARTADILADALRDNPRASVRVIPAATHNFDSSEDGFTSVRDDHAPGYLQSFTDWVLGLENGTAVASLDTNLPPDASGGDLRQLAWWESLWAQLTAVMLILLLLLAYPATGLVRRIMGRNQRPLAPVPARLIVLFGLPAVLGTFGVVMTIMVTSARVSLGPEMLGRPLIWLLLQIATWAVVAATVWGFATAWQRRETASKSEWLRTGLVLLAGVLFVPLGLFWHLLSA